MALDQPLRDFSYNLCDLVFLDEASVKMIWKYKKLFQCPNVLVQLGCGATTLFSYSVYIHCCLLVIASNTWRSKLSALPAEDRDWLEFNQVLVEVHEPLCLWTVRSHMFGFRAIFGLLVLHSEVGVRAMPLALELNGGYWSAEGMVSRRRVQ